MNCKTKQRGSLMNKLLDQQAFADHVQAATRQAGFEIEKCEGLHLYVVVQGEAMCCRLEMIYNAYQNSPQRLDDIVSAHLASLRAVPPPAPRPTEKEAAEALLPMLQPAEWLAAMQKLDIPSPIHRPFTAGLVITYVFDSPHHRAYINADILSKITASPNTTFDMFHEYALKNLRLRTTRRTYKTHGYRAKTMIVCDASDGYAAARILLPELMEKWSRRIPGNMLLGIPNRDFLIAFSDRDPSHVQTIARQVRRDAGRREHPLCADLLVWREGQVREYRPKH
jgi:uncharacterized protein YtpQ (UPF0354 family)